MSLLRRAAVATALLLALPAAAQAAPPANDAFSAAQAIAGTTFTGTNAEATTETGEPNAVPGDARSVWFSWTPAATGRFTIDLCGPATAFDSSLGVYTGSAVGSLLRLASNDDRATCEGGASRASSSVTFPATAGTTYRVRVAGYGGSAGSFAGRIDPGPNTSAIPRSVFSSGLTPDGEDVVVPQVFGADAAGFGCSVDGGDYAACDDGLHLTGLGAGAHVVRTRATVDGQTDPTPAAYTVTLDTDTPETTITAFDGTVPRATFTSPDATATFRCGFGALRATRCSSPESYATLCDATYTFAVAAIDPVLHRDQSPETRDMVGHAGACSTPVLAAQAATNDSSGFSLRITANTGGRPTNVVVEYGPTTDYGLVTRPELKVSTAAVSTTLFVDYAAPGTTVHYRIVGRTADGLDVSTPDQTVTIPAAAANSPTMTLGVPRLTPTGFELPYTTTFAAGVEPQSGFSELFVRVPGEVDEPVRDVRPVFSGSARAGTFTVTGLTPGTSYQLTPRAVIDTRTAFAPPIVVTTPVTPPSGGTTTTTTTGTTMPTGVTGTITGVTTTPTPIPTATTSTPVVPPKPAQARAYFLPRRLTVDRKGRVAFTLICPKAAGAACAGSVGVTRAGKRVASTRRFSIQAGKRLTVRFTLTSGTRKAVARASRRKGVTGTIVLAGRRVAVRLHR